MVVVVVAVVVTVVYLSFCLFVCLSVYLSVCLSFCKFENKAILPARLPSVFNLTTSKRKQVYKSSFKHES